MLLLERYNGGLYLNTFEDGFTDKLRNSIIERYWQFYKDKRYLPLNNVDGYVRRTQIRGWSRKEGRSQTFVGMSGQIVLKFYELQSNEEKVLAIARYGVSRWKNQGFGCLSLNEEINYE